MPSLFVSEESLINVAVYYMHVTNKRGVSLVKTMDETKAKALLQDPAKADKVKTVNGRFKPPTWSSQQKLFGQSARYNPAVGQNETDWSVFSDLQLKENLVAWDITDEDGREVPVTPERIDALPANIANDLLAGYRQSMSVDNEEGN